MNLDVISKEFVQHQLRYYGIDATDLRLTLSGNNRLIIAFQTDDGILICLNYFNDDLPNSTICAKKGQEPAQLSFERFKRLFLVLQDVDKELKEKDLSPSSSNQPITSNQIESVDEDEEDDEYDDDLEF